MSGQARRWCFSWAALLILPRLAAADLTLVGVPSNTVIGCDLPPAAPAVVATGACPSGALGDGLALYYAFNANHGDRVPDLSGNGHTGLVTGLTYTNGWSGGGYQFPGTYNTQIRPQGVTEVYGATALTWSAWINPAGTTLMGIMGNTLPSNGCFFLSVNPSQGSDGYIELLKARIIVTTSGAKRMKKYRKMNRRNPRLYAFEEGSVRII